MWIGKWLDRLSPETAKAVTTSLPKLKSGEDWVWTRTNLDEPLREQMPMCRSLHPDRRTPEVALKTATALNPEEFVKRLNDAIPRIVEEAKANDPREWRKIKVELEKKIAGLERDVEKAIKNQQHVAPKVVDKPVVLEAEIVRLEALRLSTADLAEKLAEAQQDTATQTAKINQALIDARAINQQAPAIPVRPAIHSASRSVVRRVAAQQSQPTPLVSSNGDFHLSKKQQEILNALAWYESIGIVDPSTLQVGAIALIDASGGHFSNVVGPLSSQGPGSCG